jgi:hypothetical protein
VLLLKLGYWKIAFEGDNGTVASSCHSLSLFVFVGFAFFVGGGGGGGTGV